MSFPAVTLGNPDGEVLVFLAGYADDNLSGFSPLFNVLKDQYFIISLCLPDYDTKQIRKPWGYNFDELLTMLHHTITELSPRKKVTMIIKTLLLTCQLSISASSMMKNKL